MWMLSRLALYCSRGSFVQKGLLTRPRIEIKLACGIATRAAMSTGFSSLSNQIRVSNALPKFGPDVKVFAPYSIFKGKAALSADPLLPKFIKLDTGDYKVERPGVIMLTIWPSIGERKYNWDKRQKFALSTTEVGSLISLGPKDSCEFFHDPSMKSSNAGQVRKSLSIKAHDDGSGYFLSLSVVNNLLKTNDRLSVPITTAEFAVMRAAFTFALPHIMGWDQYTSHLGNESSPRLVPAVPSSEWDK